MSSTERPRVLVVGGGPFQREILRAARACAEVVVVDGSPRAPGLALADHPRVVNIADPAAVVDVARAFRVAGVVTAASDVAVPAVSAVVEALGLPGLSPDAALRCRDKLACFRALAAGKHAVPETRAIDDVAQAERAAAEVGGYPVIVKPRSGGGGRGVGLVRAPSELSAAIACARRAFGAGDEAVLIQAYIDGLSVGVEAFFAGGELIAAFVLDDQFEPGYISPAGHALPSTLAPEDSARIVAAVAALGRTLGLSDGPANFDLRYAHGRTLLLEVNPRLGGNSITDLVRAAYGVDLAAATVAAALGRDPRPLLQRGAAQPIAARLVLKHGHGRARFSEPLAHDDAHPGVVSLDLLVSDGQAATLQVDEWTILGRVMTRAADSGGAAQLAEQVASEVAGRIALV
ncbi:MAG: ATP-grasp domain-containing protein [Polyangiales bacterium]